MTSPSPLGLEKPETRSGLSDGTILSLKYELATETYQTRQFRRRICPNESVTDAFNTNILNRGRRVTLLRHVLDQNSLINTGNSIPSSSHGSMSRRQFYASAYIAALIGSASAQTTTSSSPSSKTSSSDAATTTLPGGSTNSRLQVVIPIVAGVVVLAIVAMMVFIKCAANRQNSRRGRRRRKRGAELENGAFEYEGVPA